MDEYIIIGRIERAHRSASWYLLHYLRENKMDDIDRCHAREYYCNRFRDAAFIDDYGKKDYDGHLVSKISKAIIEEFQSPNIDTNVEKVIREYGVEEMTMKIIKQSAIAILSSKFPRDEVEQLRIHIAPNGPLCISHNSGKYIVVDTKKLLQKVKRASKLEDIF